jgi:nucleoside-diphosphate-sugar epimerase
MQNKAVVVGALGVIGRYIVERLVEEPNWRVVGLSRRKATDGPRYRHIAVDLLDPEDAKRKLAELTDVTHVFYAAFQGTPGSAANFASNAGPNREMLVNSVTPINRAAPHLKRVVLVTGTKYYGVHLGPLKTPMRETDPRHMPPNYYFDQIDWLTAYQRGKEWDWVELRPQTLCGFSPGSPMSILPAIAVYAAISRELGLPLRFPGKPGAFDTIYQVTESTHFANAALWAATDLRCGNEAFNITNGDYFRWRNLWPKIAAVFEMAVAGPQRICLTQHMADKGEPCVGGNPGLAKGGSNHLTNCMFRDWPLPPLHPTSPTNHCGQTNWAPTRLGCGNAEANATRDARVHAMNRSVC